MLTSGKRKQEVIDALINAQEFFPKNIVEQIDFANAHEHSKKNENRLYLLGKSNDKNMVTGVKLSIHSANLIYKLTSDWWWKMSQEIHKILTFYSNCQEANKLRLLVNTIDKKWDYLWEQYKYYNVEIPDNL